MRGYIPVFAADFGDAERMAIHQHIARDEFITSGKEVLKFEREMGKAIGRRFATMTNSGSSALLLAIAAMRWQPGDRVITPAVTFPTSISPLLHFGIVPVFLDVNLDTLNIDPDKLFQAVQDVPGVVGAVIPHTLGNPAHPSVWGPFSMSVEDSCDAFGSEVDGIPCGRFGTVSTFSFYPAHHLCTGEGGMALTNNPTLGKRIACLCSWGRDCTCLPGFDDTCNNRFGHEIEGVGPYDHKYTFTDAGFNLKPLELQGVLGNVQLEKADGYKKIRARNFAFLHAAFESIQDIVRLPVSEEGADPSWFAFPITLQKGDRAEITRRIESRGVATRLLFAGNATRQPFMKRFKYLLPYPLTNSDVVMKNTFLVGCNHTITEDECEKIAQVVKEEITS